MTRYSLFVLKVSLNSNQPTSHWTLSFINLLLIFKNSQKCNYYQH